MHNLYKLWGLGVILNTYTSQSLLVCIKEGYNWPQSLAQGQLFQCHNNQFSPQTGQVWWVSYDRGTFFLEEQIDLPRLMSDDTSSSGKQQWRIGIFDLPSISTFEFFTINTSSIQVIPGYLRLPFVPNFVSDRALDSGRSRKSQP